MECAFFLTLLVLSSCRKENGTTTIEGHTYDTTNAQLQPLSGVFVSAGKFGCGGCIISGQSTTYASTESDQNGYYKLSFETDEKDVSIYSRSNKSNYDARSFEVVKTGRYTNLDLFFYRPVTVLKIEFERIAPFSDTLLLKQYAFGAFKFIYPSQALTPIYGSVTKDKYHKIRWAILNGTSQEFIDSVYCQRGDTTSYTIRY
ncbi:MAG: hypothetical protein EOO03_10190 [Chitinophagaceae bacterium]|nr:MAG: hypothetical protein EOO03_10190 [Chitinophagaceae bacterium]